MKRRELIQAGSMAMFAGMRPFQKLPNRTFKTCLNTSTIRKQNIGLEKELKLVAETGFDSIEIWMNTLESFLKQGGKTAEIKRLSEDLNLPIESSIGFAKWIVDDASERSKALDQLKREMELLAEIGCKRIAAPPFGATQEPGLDLKMAAERFAKILELGQVFGVMPQLELWGFSANLHLLGQVLHVAAESGHKNLLILPDVYHLKRGGSPFESLGFLMPEHIEMFHINDYPKVSDRKTLTDAMRVLPGEGTAPMKQILDLLASKQKTIVLSVELFNEKLWALPADEAAKRSLEALGRVIAGYD